MTKLNPAWWMLSLGTHQEAPEWPKPLPIANLVVTAGGYEATLTWAASSVMPGYIKGYEVSCTQKPDDSPVFVASSTTYIWNDLTPETDYEFCVVTVSDLDAKSDPVCASITTGPPAVPESDQPILQTVASNKVAITNPNPDLVYYTSTATDLSPTSVVNNINNVTTPTGQTYVWAAFAGISDTSLMQKTLVTIQTITNNCPTGGTYNCNPYSCGSHECRCRDECRNCGCSCAGGDCGCSWGQCGCAGDMFWYNKGRVCDTCTSTCYHQCPVLGECSPPAGFIKQYNLWWKIDNPVTSRVVLVSDDLSNTFPPSEVTIQEDTTVRVNLNSKVRVLNDAATRVYATESESYTFLDPSTGEESTGWVTDNAGPEGEGTVTLFNRFFITENGDDRHEFEFDDVILTVFNENDELIDITSFFDDIDNNPLVMVSLGGKHQLALNKIDGGCCFQMDFIKNNEVIKTVESSYTEKELELSW